MPLRNSSTLGSSDILSYLNIERAPLTVLTIVQGHFQCRSSERKRNVFREIERQDVAEIPDISSARSRRSREGCHFKWRGHAVTAKT